LCSDIAWLQNDLQFHIYGEIAKDIGREYINKFRNFIHKSASIFHKSKLEEERASEPQGGIDSEFWYSTA
jgi:hypothetical protein